MNITRVRLRIRTALQSRPAYALSWLLISSALSIQAQVTAGPVWVPTGSIPVVNVGGGYMEAQFARLDFAEKLLDEQKRDNEANQKFKKQLLDSGAFSVLDLEQSL